MSSAHWHPVSAQNPGAPGPHAPTRINQLPMASDPHDFLHIKEVEEGQMIKVPEEGAAGLKLNSSTRFQKYVGKKQAYMYKRHFDPNVNMKKDDFLNSFGREEEKKFIEEMKKMWYKEGKKHRKDWWYMILEGKNGKKVGLYSRHSTSRSHGRVARR